MAEATLDQVTRLAEQVSSEEKRILVERLSRELQLSSQGATADGVTKGNDRMIAGVARRLNVPLLTRDPQIVHNNLVATVW